MPETDEPTQETAQGHVIPVPKRADVFADLRTVARPPDEDDEQT